jgi:hypothetical protein
MAKGKVIDLFGDSHNTEDLNPSENLTRMRLRLFMRPFR